MKTKFITNFLTSEEKELLQNFVKSSKTFTDWELDFMKGILSYGTYTDKQYRVLNKFFKRFKLNPRKHTPTENYNLYKERQSARSSTYKTISLGNNRFKVHEYSKKPRK